MGGDRGSPSDAKPWRLFVAADVPEAVRSLLAGVREPLRESHPELRWSPPENWHVTLKFLGAVRPSLVAAAGHAVAEAAATTGRFDTHLLGAAAFPSARRTGVVWVGSSGPSYGFRGIAGALSMS